MKYLLMCFALAMVVCAGCSNTMKEAGPDVKADGEAITEAAPSIQD